LITNYPKKIFLVVDGLRAHKAKSARRFVHQAKDRLRLFFLPPYSPEINPDELVWSDVKNHGVARALIRAPRDLHRAVSSRLKNPGKVRAFFQVETTRYAATGVRSAKTVDQRTTFACINRNHRIARELQCYATTAAATLDRTGSMTNQE
jgi:transposase